MRLSEWKKLHPRESSNVRTTAWRHRRQSPKTSLRHVGDNRNRLNQLRPLRDRIRKAWCASEALQLKWTAKYDELLAKRTGVPEVGPSKKKVPLQAADTQWQAGNASTPFRAELLAKTVQQYHPGQPVEMRKLCLGPFAAAQAVRSKDLDSLFVSDPDTYTKAKLPKLDVRVQCGLSHMGLCMRQDAEWANLVMHCSTQLNALVSTVSRWSLVGRGMKVSATKLVTREGQSPLVTNIENNLVFADVRFANPVLQVVCPVLLPDADGRPCSLATRDDDRVLDMNTTMGFLVNFFRRDVAHPSEVGRVYVALKFLRFRLGQSLSSFNLEDGALDSSFAKGRAH